MAQVQDIAPHPPQTRVDWATADDTTQEQSFKRHWALQRTRWRPRGCGRAASGRGQAPAADRVAPGVGAAGRFSTARAVEIAVDQLWLRLAALH